MAGLAFDPEAALRALERDPALRPLLRGPFGLHVRRPTTPFLALARAITGQQLHDRAAEAIFGRLRERLGARFAPSALLAASDEELRGAGLSRAKLAALRDLAGRAQSRQIPGWVGLEAMADEDIVALLTAVKGVGRWTVEMLLIFSLGRPDVWPAGDLAIRRAYGRHFGAEAPTAREMAARAEAWRPWRTVVAWYLWRSLEG